MHLLIFRRAEMSHAKSSTNLWSPAGSLGILLPHLYSAELLGFGFRIARTPRISVGAIAFATEAAFLAFVFAATALPFDSVPSFFICRLVTHFGNFFLKIDFRLPRRRRQTLRLPTRPAPLCSVPPCASRSPARPGAFP
ncbi:hypothetical protein MRX96_057402 [Rhipicephalus microplus]